MGFVGTRLGLPKSVKYLVRVQVGLGVVRDTIVVLEFLKQSQISSQRSVRDNCDIFQSHGIWGALSGSCVSDRLHLQPGEQTKTLRCATA